MNLGVGRLCDGVRMMDAITWTVCDLAGGRAFFRSFNRRALSCSDVSCGGIWRITTGKTGASRLIPARYTTTLVCDPINGLSRTTELALLLKGRREGSRKDRREKQLTAAAALPPVVPRT